MLSDEDKRRIAEQGQSTVQAIFDAVFVETANALDDIRVKVVEEGWFDRQVTEKFADMRDTVTENIHGVADLSRAQGLEEGYDKSMADALESVYGDAGIEAPEIEPPEEGLER